jgi:hypothetical protein
MHMEMRVLNLLAPACATFRRVYIVNNVCVIIDRKFIICVTNIIKRLYSVESLMNE